MDAFDRLNDKLNKLAVATDQHRDEEIALQYDTFDRCYQSPRDALDRFKLWMLLQIE